MTPLQEPDRGEKPVVLCVDDDLAVLSALRRQLKGEPYDVVTASSAAQALASLRGRAVGVIVTDERMPGTNGSELLAEVGERWPWIGRVLLTGVAKEKLPCGADAVVQKPWDGEALKQTLRRLVDEVDRLPPQGG